MSYIYPLNLVLLGEARILQHSETNDFMVRSLQQLKEQSTQLKEGIISNLICCCH